MTMKVQEVVSKGELSAEELLVESRVGVVRDSRDTAAVIRQLGTAAPLEMFGLRHLKRVRKVPSPDSEDGKGSQIEVYICPSTAIGDIPQEVLDYFETPLRTVDVCRVKPRDRADRDAFGEYWPVVFRPTELSEEQEKGLSSDVEAAMVTHLSAVRQYASVFSSKSTTAPSGSFGARIVNPSNNKVVIDSEQAWEYLMQRQGTATGTSTRTLATHPLYTPVMSIIEGVAAIVRGELPCVDECIQVQSATPETDQYLCTGLDIYLVNEPTAMEAMALVHSRINRVIFLNVNPSQGALGSVYSLHRIPSLNHRFRVFTGVEDKQAENS